MILEFLLSMHKKPKIKLLTISEVTAFLDACLIVEMRITEESGDMLIYSLGCHG